VGKRIISLVLAALAAVAALPAGAHQNATPPADIEPFDALGRSTLDVTVTADAVAGIPETLETGR
jgi:hypothetical protein